MNAEQHGSGDGTLKGVGLSLAWDKVAADFVFDGSWRDIYVLETTLEHWQLVLDALRASKFGLLYIRGSEPMPLPQRASDLIEQSNTGHRLEVKVGRVAVNCHFFLSREIEFDLDPREVSGQTELDAILAFMQTLAAACKKPVLLTPENVRDEVIIRVDANGEIECFPPLAPGE